MFASNNMRRTIASALTTLSLSVGAQFSSARALEPVAMYSSDTYTTYSIDNNSQPVLVAWKAAQPSAVLIAVHGFGLHKYAFESLAERMQRDGISTYALDVRGFGGWMQSNRASQINFPGTMRDLLLLVSSIRNETPATPVFLMGESMGGAIALAFAAQNPGVVDGVISSVPGNERFRSMSTAARIVAGYVLSAGGKINLKKLLVNQVTDHDDLKQSWRSDKQAKLRVSLKELLRFNRFMKQSPNMVRRISNLPVLVVQGHRDNLVKPAGTQKLFDDLSTQDKQLLMLENQEHLTLEEGQFDDTVVNEVEHWLSIHERQPLVASNE